MSGEKRERKRQRKKKKEIEEIEDKYHNSSDPKRKRTPCRRINSPSPSGMMNPRMHSGRIDGNKRRKKRGVVTQKKSTPSSYLYTA
jgi:hypothetical protein